MSKQIERPTDAIEFRHKLYGKAYLIRNQMFRTFEKPGAVNYMLPDSNEVRHSGIYDAGLENFPVDVLKTFGY